MKNNLIYYIMSFILYLYPPFIFFLVMINFETMSDQNYWIIGMITNVVLVLLTTLVLYVLAKRKKIPCINKDEKQYFLFGYVGNIIVYLYVYQYIMRIEHYVSVFSLVLILVIAYKYIISKKIAFKEIFIFSIVFSIIDYVIIIASGNTLFSETNVLSTTQMIVFQILLIGALLFSLCWFFYQLYKNHRWYLLRLIMLGFIVITLILFYVEAIEEVILTCGIIAVFVWLVDIILNLIHKTFKLHDFAYYARIIMMIVILMNIKIMALYRFPNFELSYMFLLISTFYVSAFSNIVMQITPKDAGDIDITLSVEVYIEKLFKPLITRYKDVLVLRKEIDYDLDLSKLGRHIIYQSSESSFETLEMDAISFMIVYEDMFDQLDHIKTLYPQLNVCFISTKVLKHASFRTEFTDFKYHVYTR